VALQLLINVSQISNPENAAALGIIFIFTPSNIRDVSYKNESTRARIQFVVASMETRAAHSLNLFARIPFCKSPACFNKPKQMSGNGCIVDGGD
jgi:hypothetical protein